MTSAVLSLPAPAKLNLFLHICGHRSDGYHELQTVFQFLDYADELHFSLRQDRQIQLSPALEGLKMEDNLIYRAARLLQEASGSGYGADIRLDKRLPMGGGIGGGSSDAASTLLGLDRLWQTGLSQSQLQSLGAKLGADVPVFVFGHSAWAEGIGERLEAVEIPEPWYLVLVPDCHVSTAEIFSHRELTRNTPALKIAAFLDQGSLNSRVEFRNDCEALVCQLYPPVAKALNWLKQQGPASLTGTGACVFAPFDTKAQAERVLSQLPDSLRACVRGSFVARGCNSSPLHEALKQR